MCVGSRNQPCKPMSVWECVCVCAGVVLFIVSMYEQLLPQQKCILDCHRVCSLVPPLLWLSCTGPGRNEGLARPHQSNAASSLEELPFIEADVSICPLFTFPWL